MAGTVEFEDICELLEQRQRIGGAPSICRFFDNCDGVHCQLPTAKRLKKVISPDVDTTEDRVQDLIVESLSHQYKGN
jgi:hypothetical protein